MKNFAFIFTFILFCGFKTLYAENCVNNKDALSVATYASKSIVMVTLSRIAPEFRDQKIEELLIECIDVTKVSKRVLGRAKWSELSQEQQDNFLKEYPHYFFHTFKDIIISSLTNVQDVTVKPTSINNVYQATFKTNKEPISINLTLEEKNGFYKITDGAYQNVSVVETQRNSFDMMYEKDKNVIKNFKASKYINKK